MSQQKYLQELIAVHRARLQELKNLLPAKSPFEKLKGILKVEKHTPDHSGTLRELEYLEKEFRKLQAELKKVKTAGEPIPKLTAAPRETLSTAILSTELTKMLHQAVALMRRKNKQVMSVEITLLAILTLPEVAAYRLLRSLSLAYGFNWDTFSWYVDRMSDEKAELDVKVDFVTDRNERVPLAKELLVVLNEGVAIANTLNETRCNTVHLLAAIAGLNSLLVGLNNRAFDGVTWLFQKLSITRQIITEAMTSHSIPPKPEQRLRFISSTLRKREGLDLRSLGDRLIAEVVIPLNLGVEAEAQIKAEYIWLFAAIDHYRKIQQIQVDLKASVPVSIPPKAEKKDQQANNTVIMLDFLLPSHYNLLIGLQIESIESIIKQINIYMKNLAFELDKQAQLGGQADSNIALKNSIDAQQKAIIERTQELANLMQQIYGVKIYAPELVAEKLP